MNGRNEKIFYRVLISKKSIIHANICMLLLSFVLCCIRQLVVVFNSLHLNDIHIALRNMMSIEM